MGTFSEMPPQSEPTADEGVRLPFLDRARTPSPALQWWTLVALPPRDPPISKRLPQTPLQCSRDTQGL